MRVFSGLLALVFAATSFVAAAPTGNDASVQDAINAFTQATKDLEPLNNELANANGATDLGSIASKVTGVLGTVNGVLQSGNLADDSNSADFTSAGTTFANSLLTFVQNIPTDDDQPFGILTPVIHTFHQILKNTPVVSDIAAQVEAVVHPLLGLDPTL